MLESIFRRKPVRARIEANPIGSILLEYAAYLSSRGHRTGPMHQYVFAVEHFGQWLGDRPINCAVVNRFIQRHLPRCRCTKPCSRNVACVRAALRQLLDMLGQERPRAAEVAALDRLLRDYEGHLRQVCGLSNTTVFYRLRYARDLLRRFNPRRARDLRRWSPDQIARYVSVAGRKLRPSSGQVLACSIRSFLKFLLLRGFIGRDLAGAVPSFAQWRLASLPGSVDRADLHRLVAAADPVTCVGMRDRAVLLCLTELGLRAVDVAMLGTDDVDLVDSVLRLRRQKQRDQVGVPMTKRLMHAIREYLRRGRPCCTSGALFVKHRAPFGGALKPIGIRGIVVRRAAVAGLANRIRGTHVIRHSIATTLINAGAPIKQIADLLGHQSIDTTAIYAKVDLASLRSVTLPWPAAEESEVLS
jgi:site-specific recombinase XerD